MDRMDRMVKNLKYKVYSNQLSKQKLENHKSNNKDKTRMDLKNNFNQKSIWDIRIITTQIFRMKGIEYI